MEYSMIYLSDGYLYHSPYLLDLFLLVEIKYPFPAHCGAPHKLVHAPLPGTTGACTIKRGVKSVRKHSKHSKLTP